MKNGNGPYRKPARPVGLLNAFFEALASAEKHFGWNFRDFL